MLAELEPLANTPAAYGFVALLGLLWGSFGNVCIYRLPPTDKHPKGRSVVAPGSHCFACNTPIRWYDNVPLLSYLWLRGQCRSCKAPFSSRYLIVEAVTGLLFGLSWWFMVVAPALWLPFDQRVIHFAIAAAFVFTMVVIAFIDLDHKLILNKVTIPSMIVFYGASLLLGEHRWYDGLVGMLVGYGVPWLIGEIYYRVTKREGLGLGDGMLLAVVGALLGWRGVVVSLFGGSLIGSVLGIPLLVSQRLKSKPGTDGEPSLLKLELPFGPFLAMAAVFYLFAEPWIQLNFRLTGG
ncbi:MAG: peptidase domain protein [Myxococcales bacterium]|nr:peptidase domain protein [Myxococcales bacterium]